MLERANYLTKSRVVPLRKVRTMSDRDLVNFFLDNPGSRAVAMRVILERMNRDGYTDFYRWVWDDVREGKLKVRLSKPRAIPFTTRGETLEKELSAIIRSGYPFDDVDEPDRCREFCSDRGNILSLTEDDLTPRQKRMLGLLRDRSNRWLKCQM